MSKLSKTILVAGLILAALIVAILIFRPSSGIKTEPGEIPQTSISNGLIDATLYLPDTLNGYYRGARFDWSGVIPALKYSGHDYFGQWYTKYDPYLHDAIMGPVNDFYPLGYDESKPGDTYIKIGIGAFTKQDDRPYSFSRPAKLINSGKWKVSRKKDQVKFTHILEDSGYFYEYTKTVALMKGKPEMILKHTITNHGQKTIETDVYNHNFLVIDKQPTGPDFSVEFPFNLIGQFRRGADVAEYKDNRILIHQQFSPGQNIHGGNIEGFGDSPDDYDIKVENHKTGAGVRITCDKPLSRLVFWASYATLSAEPYTHVRVEPGEQFSWNITYQFYTLE
jgi:hypothetical protein